MLKGLFFDFDGLILDTETPELVAWEEEFAKYGQILPAGYWASTIGKGADDVEEWPIDILARLVPNLPSPETVEDEVRVRRLAGIAANPVLPGVRELMTIARGREMVVAVVSSSMHPWVDGHLDRLGLASLVNFTVCRGDTPRAKPWPDLYLRALDLSGLAPGEVAVFEDSPNGALAALAAGLSVWTVPNPVTTPLDFPPGIAGRLRSLTEFRLE